MVELNTNLLSRGSKISGCASILGSWQICHQVCTSLVAALATIGIAVQGMPLLFLNEWQWPLWVAALVLFGIVLTIRVGMKMRCITTRGVFGNAGLLMAGAPFVGDTIGQIRLIGLIIVFAVLLWWLKDLVVRRTENGWVIDLVEQGRKVVGGLVGAVAVVALLFITRGSSIQNVGPGLVPGRHAERGFLGRLASRGGAQGPALQGVGGGRRMKFTLFDIAQAKELMDKNGDGKCDACGMAINQCMESGMMECTMDANAKIGLLGSQHIHAQLAVLRNGQPMDLAPYTHKMDAQGGGTGSSFIHVEGPDFNKLHMHATGVPLKMFFNSIGLQVDPAKTQVKVNNAPSTEGLEYVFNDSDIIKIQL